MEHTIKLELHLAPELMRLLECVIEVGQPRQAQQEQQTAVKSGAVGASVPKQQTTETEKYTLEQIGQAATRLLDSGRLEVLQLPQKFGVENLAEVPEEQFPQLVRELRGMGAEL